jgi:hypothetical protein
LPRSHLLVTPIRRMSHACLSSPADWRERVIPRGRTTPGFPGSHWDLEPCFLLGTQWFSWLKSVSTALQNACSLMFGGFMGEETPSFTFQYYRFGFIQQICYQPASMESGNEVCFYKSGKVYQIYKYLRSAT